MKRFAWLALLLAAAPAFAAYPTVDVPGLQAARGPVNRRVAIIRPERWTAITGTLNDAACVANGVYQAMDMLRAQGCEVHYYNTRTFDGFANATALWRTLGNHYALAIVLNPGSTEAGFQRYVNADSTNVQILVVGGVRTNNVPTWQPDTGSAAAAGRRGFFDAAGGGFEGDSNVRFSCLVPYTSTGLGTDTIWSSKLATGRMQSDSAGVFRAIHAGITSVVRVLHPLLPGQTNVAWAGGHADSASTRMPGASWATPKTPGSETSATDSVAREGEYLGPIWKVKYANGRETWFFKFNGTTTANVHNPALLWACIARFVDVPPIKWALDWDDVTDAFDLNNFPRWRNTQAESALATLRRVGVVPSNCVNPRNASAYIRGVKPDYEAAWSGAPHTFLRQMTWIHHAHDSTTWHPSSNLAGTSGGYFPGNGSTVTGQEQYGRRFPNRLAPGENYAAGNFVGAGGNFGIKQRLDYSDSVRRAVAPQSVRPPYLAFPANQMIPVNWKVRANPAGYENQMTATAADCPLDSVLWAYDHVRGTDGTDGGKLYLRSGFIFGPKIEALWADRDSFVAASLALYPRERFTVRVGSRYVQAEILHSFNQGIGGRAATLAVVNFRAATVLGLANRAWHAEMHNPTYGESWASNYDSDVNAIMNFGTGRRDFPAKQSTRIIYLHPGQQTTLATFSGDMHVDLFLLGIHSTIRAMDRIAGKAVTRCVPAWTVYEQ